MTETDKRIAEIIELRPSMVYKIRKGHRYPSFDAMIRIEKELNWNVQEQSEARRLGSYHEKFEAAAISRFDAEKQKPKSDGLGNTETP